MVAAIAFGMALTLAGLGLASMALHHQVWSASPIAAAPRGGWA